MEPAALLMFVGVFTLFAAYPGPAIVTIVSHALVQGRSGMTGLIAGIILGDMFWLSVTLAGLSVLAAQMGWAFAAIKYGGALYLLYMAYGAWRASNKPLLDAGAAMAERMPFDRRKEMSSLLNGLALTLGNPKTVMFYLALLPGFLDLGALSAVGVMELFALVVVLLIAVLGAYAVLAERLRRVLHGPRAGRVVNRVSSVLLAGTAVVVASR